MERTVCCCHIFNEIINEFGNIVSFVDYMGDCCVLCESWMACVSGADTELIFAIGISNIDIATTARIWQQRQQQHTYIVHSTHKRDLLDAFPRE